MLIKSLTLSGRYYQSFCIIDVVGFGGLPIARERTLCAVERLDRIGKGEDCFLQDDVSIAPAKK